MIIFYIKYVYIYITCIYVCTVYRTNMKIHLLGFEQKCTCGVAGATLVQNETKEDYLRLLLIYTIQKYISFTIQILTFLYLFSSARCEFWQR
jgi:hypothetical protein